MGEAKKKQGKPQTFSLTMTGKQRHGLYQVFIVASNTKERRERRMLSRAFAAFELEDFEDLRPEIPENESSAVGRRESQDAFRALIDGKGKEHVVTIENIETAQGAIDSVAKAGGLSGQGALILAAVEDLFEECKEGLHGVESDGVETAAETERPEAVTA
jgi:hypothetical protein